MTPKAINLRSQTTSNPNNTCLAINLLSYHPKKFAPKVGTNQAKIIYKTYSNVKVHLQLLSAEVGIQAILSFSETWPLEETVASLSAN